MGSRVISNSSCGRSARAPLIGNIEGRNVKSLNGTWNALIDPNQQNVFNDLFHYAERNHKPAPGELLELTIENGTTLKVPGDWNTQDDRLFFYNGKVWYKRDFQVAKKEDKRYFLHFGAINYKAQIYVNGKHVASHTGGFTSFNCEITDAIADGNNFVVINANNTLTNSDIPTSRTDWLNYGGITRDVNLVELPKAYIENYKIQLNPDNPKEILGWAMINGASSGDIKVMIPELKINESFPLENGKAEIRFKASPEFWSIGNPKLYDVELTYGEEVVKDLIGFRTIKIEDSQILLNGKPTMLKGISIHEEAIGADGRAHSYEHAIELLQAAKELNCNFVRLAHYTHNEHMLRAADKMGLLVWAEIPVYWNLEFEKPAVLEMAKTRMDEMIGRDQNRVSIAFWSLGNETPISDARNTFFRALNTHVKSVDDTRLTTAALVFGGEEIGKMAKEYYFPTMAGEQFDTWDIHIEDELASIVDLPAINQYFGWYYSGFLAPQAKIPPLKARQVMLDNMSKIRFHIPGDKAYVFSETGAGARRGISGNEEDMVIFSEEYQALVYKKQIEMWRNQKGLVGMSPWILKDFRSTMRQRQGIQDYWNLKGLIDDNGNPKKAFFVLQDFYDEKN
ncbi:beta-glucuronidase [Aggregatimonas sangjinii]|uniref:Beta-glucuronidase n=1 Tax=Aggregatimonas sangjinii TaxID=2583587 RepID=A0A5B7SQ16_9FLAO|nr:glycoside hydrolase family 2 TIM barrel-domain containing protein [Aggregatimonas sangjinii]QCW99488.1 beta-glucuronidase [Aggregatimonas sangjinii]